MPIKMYNGIRTSVRKLVTTGPVRVLADRIPSSIVAICCVLSSYNLNPGVLLYLSAA